MSTRRSRKPKNQVRALTSIEVCAGAGGQALGLEQAGFEHLACVENDKNACETLRHNRPNWRIDEADLETWEWDGQGSVDLLAGGVPCPPFSLAGKQLGSEDERDLFPAILRLAGEIEPKALMIENVRGLLGKRFDGYRAEILSELDDLGYVGEWRLLQAADFGVPQLRPRSILVAMRPQYWSHFQWPDPTHAQDHVNVGDALRELMAADGWKGADKWAKSAKGVAPTLVGGSKKHGGADLGPTRAKADWRERLGVDAKGVADGAPTKSHIGMPRLTVPMAAVIQGFPTTWQITGRKTAAYRQVGNAFPPPVAKAVGSKIARAIQEGVSREEDQ
ncbi:MAG: DNA cytosine methyltransferase [Actinomycetes bacterium]